MAIRRPVPSRLKVWYAHGKTGYINLLPPKPRKYLQEYPTLVPPLLLVHPQIGICLPLHVPSGPPLASKQDMNKLQ